MGNKQVLVGMSGGVDSSYAAAILKEQGYEVVGAMLNLWTEPSQKGENRCCSLDSQYLARRAAAKLDIPFYIIDAKDEFRTVIVEQFIKDYTNGLTPNPCIACNAKVRWKLLLEQAKKLGIGQIATGHYATIKANENSDYQLYKGLDGNKDQSYVLSMLDIGYLAATILPLGLLTKEEVRARSKELSLPSFAQPDSQDLCFLGEMDYRDFLKRYAQKDIIPGDIVDETGKVIGKHNGLPLYTIGQRKGLRVANNSINYVIFKDINNNQIIVSKSLAEKPSSFNVHKMNWLIDFKELKTFECTVKIRYRSKEMSATVHLIDQNSISVELHLSVKPDITPGQIAVFYQKELCMGGGIIV